MSSIDVAREETAAGSPSAGPPDALLDSPASAVAIMGGLAVVLYVIAFGITPTHAPNSGTPAVNIVHYAAVHRGTLLVSELLLGAALAATVLFGAAIYRMMRRLEAPQGWLAVGGVVALAAGAGVFGAGIALLMTATYRPDLNVIRALWDAGWIVLNSSGFLFGAWITIVALGTLRTGMLPAWTAWIGFPIGFINLIGPFALKAGTGFFSPQGTLTLLVGVTFPIWVIAVSVGAWRVRRAPVAAVR